ncbi:MAG: dihydroorotase, partial [Alphaproteobacteria bacterium]|nr:dihydroorotase [Alphaproteobacteria bacterium]
MVEDAFPIKAAASSAIAHQPLALINARLIDPAALEEKSGGVLIVDGVIRDLGPAVNMANLPVHAQ